jgi:hypothetical protein
VVVRASSFSWCADGESLDATRQPDGQSDYVVSGSHVFCRCPNPGRRSGRGARECQGASRSFCSRCSGRPERWPAIGGAARETTPRPGARLASHEIYRRFSSPAVHPDIPRDTVTYSPHSLTVPAKPA